MPEGRRRPEKAGEGWRRLEQAPSVNCLVFHYGYGFSLSDCSGAWGSCFSSTSTKILHPTTPNLERERKSSSEPRAWSSISTPNRRRLHRFEAPFLQIASVEPNFNIKSSTSTRILHPTAPNLQRERKSSSKPQAWSSISTPNQRHLHRFVAPCLQTANVEPNFNVKS